MMDKTVYIIGFVIVIIITLQYITYYMCRKNVKSEVKKITNFVVKTSRNNNQPQVKVPEVENKEENKEENTKKDTSYIFSNCSGNLIKNIKNSQLTDKTEQEQEQEQNQEQEQEQEDVNSNSSLDEGDNKS